MGEPNGSNVPLSVSESIGYGSETQGSDTSQYLQEKKSTEIPSVVASEHGIAYTDGFTCRGCGTLIMRTVVSRRALERAAVAGDSPLREND